MKGIPLVLSDGAKKRVPKFTNWTLAMLREETDEWDLCEAAKLLLARVSADLRTWEEITSQSEIVMSFGLSMDGSNRGYTLDTELLRCLSERSIRADFDQW